MTVRGTCHCGAVRMRVASAPREVGECNCDPSDVVIEGETAAYIWGDRTLELRRCHVCGCTTHWVSTDPRSKRMGVNARMLDGFDRDSVEIRKIDGASF